MQLSEPIPDDAPRHIELVDRLLAHGTEVPAALSCWPRS